MVDLTALAVVLPISLAAELLATTLQVAHQEAPLLISHPAHHPMAPVSIKHQLVLLIHHLTTAVRIIGMHEVEIEVEVLFLFAVACVAAVPHEAA